MREGREVWRGDGSVEISTRGGRATGYVTMGGSWIDGGEPRADLTHRVVDGRGVQVHVPDRFPERAGDVLRELRAAGERPVGKDQGGVGVLDVPARACFVVVVGVGFAKVGIAIGDGAVLGSSTPGNPAADGKAEGEGGIESGTIGTGLGAGDDLLDGHDEAEVIVGEGVDEGKVGWEEVSRS